MRPILFSILNLLHLVPPFLLAALWYCMICRYMYMYICTVYVYIYEAGAQNPRGPEAGLSGGVGVSWESSQLTQRLPPLYYYYYYTQQKLGLTAGPNQAIQGLPLGRNRERRIGNIETGTGTTYYKAGNWHRDLETVWRIRIRRIRINFPKQDPEFEQKLQLKQLNLIKINYWRKKYFLTVLRIF